MKSINLLPKEEKKKDVKSIAANVLLVLAIILFVSAILFTLFLFDMDSSISDKLNQHEAVNIKAQNYVNQLKNYSDFEAGVESKRKVIEDVKKNRVIWSGVIYDIGRLMPGEAYLYYFEARGSELYDYVKSYEEGTAEEGARIVSFVVMGKASSYIDVLKLSIELKKIKNIKDVWITAINEAVVPELELDVLDFTIEAYWDTGAFLEGITKKNQAQEEDTLDNEMMEIQ
ncbi:MAG: hypothetical protein JW770_02395 [Actinobacteria bacterium]|nr:hypothetical protein [Actinomycetota bacterium]